MSPRPPKEGNETSMQIEDMENIENPVLINQQVVENPIPDPDKKS
jgi:hypothetical protein